MLGLVFTDSFFCFCLGFQNMDDLPSSPGLKVSTKTVTADVVLNLVLPSLMNARKREPKKTSNQRVEAALLEAEAEKKKSAHFWDDTRRVKKAQRLSRCGNLYLTLY